MADELISDIPNTVTVLGAADLLEFEQGGISKQGAAALFRAFLLDPDTALTADSDDLAASQKAVKAFIASAIATAIAALAPPPISIGIQYQADVSATTDADPGAGNLRWNNATQASATVLYLDDVTTGGTSLTGLWAALSSGGFAYLQHATDQDVWSINQITNVVDASGYAKLTITRLAGAGSFAASDAMLVTIEQGAAVSGVTSVNGAAGTPTIRQALAIACSDESTALTAGTNKVRFINPYSTAFNVVAVVASLSTAQTSGSIFTVDINEAGATILSTKLTIDNTETNSSTAATAAVISDASIAAYAEITVDIDQIGDGTAKGLKVYLIGYPTP